MIPFEERQLLTMAKIPWLFAGKHIVFIFAAKFITLLRVIKKGEGTRPVETLATL